MRSLSCLVKPSYFCRNLNAFGSKTQCRTITQVLNVEDNFTKCKTCLNYRYFLVKQAKKQWPKKIISGIQPTGILHIGNYFGAVQRWVRMQEDAENVTFFIADLHSMTMPYVRWCIIQCQTFLIAILFLFSSAGSYAITWKHFWIDRNTVGMWHWCEKIDHFLAIVYSATLGTMLDIKLSVYDESTITFATIQREISSSEGCSNRSIYVSSVTSSWYSDP